MKHHCIMGNDYYITNEHRVSADGTTRPLGRDIRLRARSRGNTTTGIEFR